MRTISLTAALYAHAAEFERALGSERLDWGTSFWNDMSDDGEVPLD
jgi:hypothetical protein